MNAITALTAAPTGGTRLSTQPVIALLDRVLESTESSFLKAGTRLETAVDAIRQMQVLFDRMQAQLSPEQADRLLGLVSRTKQNLGAIESEFDNFLAGSAGLRAVVRAVRIEVEDLDRVVRTIANVSINARIQASRLNPPRPQVTAFLERLSEMVEEAETNLGAVKSAMSGILDRMSAMDAETVNLQDALKAEVLPTLARFAAQGQTVHDGQEELISTSATVAARMRQIFAEVSRLVVGLQSGDAVRQRLERVREVLHQVDGASDTAPILMPLSYQLAAAARVEAESESDSAVTGIGAVLQGARLALKTATDFYFGRSGGRVALLAADNAGSGPLDKLLDNLRANLALLSGLAGEVTTQVETILHQESRLRQISHQVRLSGLNAVLICAKLGEEGRSLRELAQWLRHLTDESDTIMGRLQGALDRTRSELGQAGSDRIGQLQGVLSAFLDSALELQEQLGELDTCLTGAVSVCQDTDQALGAALGGAQLSMVEFRNGLEDVQQAETLMRFAGAILPAPSLPVTEATPMADLLHAIRRRYTMQSERDLHDHFIGPMVSENGALAAMPVAQPAAEPKSDDMDDIFF